MTITPEQSEMIADAIESALIDVHVSLPGKVEKYDALTQTANIELQVKRTLPTGDGGYADEDLPVLQNVPVQFPRTNAVMVTLPVKAGDFGLVVFSEMSLDQWRSRGLNSPPGDIGRHTLAGGVFQPGLMPLAQTILPAALGGDDIGDDVIVGFIGGGQLRVKPGGTVEAVAGGLGGQSADDFVAMATKVLSEFSALKVAYDSHTHAYAPGPGSPVPTAVPIPLAPTPSSVASSNLKGND